MNALWLGIISIIIGLIFLLVVFDSVDAFSRPFPLILCAILILIVGGIILVATYSWRPYNYEKAFEESKREIILCESYLDNTNEFTMEVFIGCTKQYELAVKQYNDVIDACRKSQTYSDFWKGGRKFSLGDTIPEKYELKNYQFKMVKNN